MIDFFERTTYVKDTARACGDLVLCPNTKVAKKLSFTNEAAAGIYELYIMALLRLNGGRTTMNELLSVDLEWEAMRLAIHSLRLKGLIACPNPYNSDLEDHMPILMVEGAKPRIPSRRVPSMTVFRIGRWVKRKLRAYRHTIRQYDCALPLRSSPTPADVSEFTWREWYEDSGPF